MRASTTTKDAITRMGAAGGNGTDSWQSWYEEEVERNSSSRYSESESESTGRIIPSLPSWRIGSGRMGGGSSRPTSMNISRGGGGGGSHRINEDSIVM
jgi:hypothetical protein